jgi:hypothetical protein
MLLGEGRIVKEAKAHPGCNAKEEEEEEDRGSNIENKKAILIKSHMTLVILTSCVSFPAETGNFRHRFQTESGSHPVPHSVSIDALFPWFKRPGRDAYH